MPRFSVIIPVYNRADLVERTLASVYAQTFTDFEIIAVDDGSRDNSLEVLRRHEPRIRIVAQQNMGLGAARNAGARVATGEYILPLDSDDLWFPWTLKTLDLGLREHADPAWIVGTYAAFAQESELEVHTCVEGSVRTRAYDDYLRSHYGGGPIACGTVAIRRDAYAAAGGFTELRVNCEDTDMWLKMGATRGYVRIESPVILGVRRGLVSMVSNYAHSLKGLEFVVSQERSGAYPGGAERAWERRDVIAAHHRSFCMTALLGGDFAVSGATFRKSLGWNLRLGRVRFLVAFPLMWLARRMRSAQTSRSPS